MDKVIGDKIAAFFANYKLRDYDENHILVFPQDELKDVFYLVKGEVRQYDISEQGDKVVLNIFKPPAFFPMSWAMNKTINQYYFETVSKVKLRPAPAKKTVEFLQDNPDVTFDLLGRVYMGTDVLLRRMAHAMGSRARKRLLYELHLETQRYGVKQSDNSYLVPIHIYELAARTGMTRETASRELAKLSSLGITNHRNGITINNIQTLENELKDGL
jgi:CRP-like cAMP-binding protein